MIYAVTTTTDPRHAHDTCNYQKYRALRYHVDPAHLPAPDFLLRLLDLQGPANAQSTGELALGGNISQMPNGQESYGLQFLDNVQNFKDSPKKLRALHYFEGHVLFW